MDLRLSNRTVLVTGGASGIGDAVARTFVAEGARVIIADINEEQLTRQHEEIRKGGGQSSFIVSDLSTQVGIDSMVARGRELYGEAPDILVNNVGIGSLRSFEETSNDEWARTFDLNFFATVRTSRALLPAMKQRGSGSVVCITSDLAKQPEDVITDYAASKAAVASVAKSLSRFYAPEVRVNCVAPGPIHTPFYSDESYGWQKHIEAAYEVEGEAALDALVQDRAIPMGRMGRAAEVAAAVVFLASEVSAFTTGATLSVDGGSTRSAF